jgi:hypothetical protein
VLIIHQTIKIVELVGMPVELINHAKTVNVNAMLLSTCAPILASIF